MRIWANLGGDKLSSPVLTKKKKKKRETNDAKKSTYPCYEEFENLETYG